MSRRTVVLVLALLSGTVAGCQAPHERSIEPVRYEAQHSLLQKAKARAESAPADASDAELVRLLGQLETEIADAEHKYEKAQQRIAELTTEVAKLRRAAGLAVHHVEILYFTRTTETGIDLWVTPFDRDNDAVKTAGDLSISLHRPRPWVLRGRSGKICTWVFTAKDLEKRWEGQLFEGYHLRLAWPQGKTPDMKEVVLRVDFTTTEGKTHSATKDLNIGE